MVDPKPTVGGLFSGIGGLELGFQRAGFEVSWQVEIDPWCRRILENNFPDAERYADVRKCDEYSLKRVDVIVGGFPCQDISNSGKRAGIDGANSGLWQEYRRIIRLLRPQFALIENVAAIVGFGLDRVLSDIAEIGFDAEWQVISAANIGASQWRERIWILAYPGHEGVHERGIDSNALSNGGFIPGTSRYELSRRQKISDEILAECSRSRAGGHPHWLSEPSVARVADGVPFRVDRIRGLGNAVVPQIPEMYARRIRELIS